VRIEILLYIGGIFHLIWALFDLFWTKLFNWKETLAPLDDLNRVLLPILNKLLVVIFLAFAYISFFHTSDLINTNIGTTLLLFIIIFWIVRTIEQLYYFRFNKVNKLNVSISSLVPFFPFNKMSNKAILYYYFFVTFIIMILLYLIPLINKVVN
jgi:hypothetical protein